MLKITTMYVVLGIVGTTSIYKLMILYSKKSHFDRSTQWAFNGDNCQYLVFSPWARSTRLSLFLRAKNPSGVRSNSRRKVAPLVLLGRYRSAAQRPTITISPVLNWVRWEWMFEKKKNEDSVLCFIYFVTFERYVLYSSCSSSKHILKIFI